MAQSELDYITSCKNMNEKGIKYPVYTKAFLKEWLEVLEDDLTDLGYEIHFRRKLKSHILSRLIRLLEAEIALVNLGEIEKTHRKLIEKEVLFSNMMLYLFQITLIEKNVHTIKMANYDSVAREVLAKKRIVNEALENGKTMQQINDILKKEINDLDEELRLNGLYKCVRIKYINNVLGVAF